MSGRAWSNYFLIILYDIPFLNSITCILMYLNKASKDQLPANMIKNMGKLSKSISVDLTEWVPVFLL